MFIEKGAKVNTDFYFEMLKSKVLPCLNDTDWENGWIFQQDGDPSLEAVWNSIESETVRKCCADARRRFEAVIEAEGGYFE